MVHHDGRQSREDPPPKLNKNQQSVYEYLCEIESQKLPGDRILSESTGVKRSTARSAVLSLERKGLVRIVDGIVRLP